MLTTEQIRRVAQQSGARDIEKVETDIILTYLLQLFHEKGITRHVAFKGGTMLRKMIFGPRGRYSTDLDFTKRTDISDEGIMELMLDALSQSYHGLSFRFDRDKDWYFTDDGLAANPVCFHAGNEKGVKIKLQVSLREKPVLPARAVPQVKQDYFLLLPFKPADIPSLTYEEAVSEKIRAASQRSKIRDLHDLSEVATRPVTRDLVRPLAVIKLWESRTNVCHSAAIRPSAHLPIPRSRTSTSAAWPERIQRIGAAMNHSMYGADRKTHLKIVVVGLLCACFVLIVGVLAHTAQIDLGTAPLVKAGGPSVIGGQPPVIH